MVDFNDTTQQLLYEYMDRLREENKKKTTKLQEKEQKELDIKEE